MSEKRIKRILEIIPGVLSWSLIIFLIVLFVFKPLSAIVVIIIYLLYWVARLLYSSILLIMAHHRMHSKKNNDWLSMCRGVDSDLKLENIVHVVLYTIYKEPQELISGSLKFLKATDYPSDKIIVVLAGEERSAGAYEKLKAISDEFRKYFLDIIITIHPQNVPGEIPAKGANATYAAKQVKIYLEQKGYDSKDIIISCFDADTCPDEKYFSCLTYNFLVNPKRYHTSFQPLPIYSNNIYTAPAFARVIETGSTFWQYIEGMRYEKFITFSSHSMSFKTLVEVDYWPVDLISDDSLIFWKCFLKFKGDYKTFPLDIPVYMDIAVGASWLDTVKVQYKQKRRWAWGVENFIFLSQHFLKEKEIPFTVKFRKLYQILDGHVNWATWAIVISFITPLILFSGRIVLKNSLALFNLSYINSVVFHSLSFILLLCIIISLEFLPPRPKNISRFVYVTFLFQWLLTPFISAVLGSFPSLDAQTRLMFGRYLSFTPTPKSR
ncbi:MAG: glycosyltransferase family 2 protein [Candidatus Omnitrophica bacterium]|nr:glycosyltransferase family 2 protein [Candidatus Omnitrophota bacterium]